MDIILVHAIHTPKKIRKIQQNKGTEVENGSQVVGGQNAKHCRHK